MFKLDNDFLVSLGLGSLPVDEKNRLLQVIYERLEMNVGMRLAEKMTDQQLDEFEGFIDRNDEAGALHWLETNFPNYKDVVAEELEKLKKEVGASAPQILVAAQNASPEPQAIATGQQPMQPAPQQFQQVPQTAPQQPYNPPAPQQPYQAPQPAYQQPSFQPAAAPQFPQSPAPAQEPQQFQPAPGFGQPPAGQTPTPQFQSPAPYPTQPEPQQYGQPQPPDTYAPPMPTQQPPAGPGL